MGGRPFTCPPIFFCLTFFKFAFRPFSCGRKRSLILRRAIPPSRHIVFRQGKKIHSVAFPLFSPRSLGRADEGREEGSPFFFFPPLLIAQSQPFKIRANSSFLSFFFLSLLLCKRRDSDLEKTGAENREFDAPIFIARRFFLFFFFLLAFPLFPVPTI